MVKKLPPSSIFQRSSFFLFKKKKKKKDASKTDVRSTVSRDRMRPLQFFPATFSLSLLENRLTESFVRYAKLTFVHTRLSYRCVLAILYMLRQPVDLSFLPSGFFAQSMFPIFLRKHALPFSIRISRRSPSRKLPNESFVFFFRSLEGVSNKRYAM